MRSQFKNRKEKEIIGGLGVEGNVSRSREVRLVFLTLDESYHTDSWQIGAGRPSDLTEHVSTCRWN